MVTNLSRIALAVGAALCVLVTGCSKSAPAAMPEVNDANCRPDALARMEDKDLEQRLAALCVRRGGSAPSSPKNTF